MDAASKELPKATAPAQPSKLYQEKGTRLSRALPYRLHCTLGYHKEDNQIQLVFENKGDKGAVYHVYNMKRLDMIPRRYTIEAAKSLKDEWDVMETDGAYDLEVYGPNGYFHKFAGNIKNAEPEITLQYDHTYGSITVLLGNNSSAALHVEMEANAYAYPKSGTISLIPGKKFRMPIDLKKSSNWYDFTVKSKNGFVHRFAGRVETGQPGMSDPAMATELL